MIEHFFSGSKMEKDLGYCRACVVDDWVFVSGTAGNDWSTGELLSGVEAQTHRMIDNLTKALESVGASWGDVVKRAIYLADAKDTKLVYSIICDRTRHLTTPASQGFEMKFLDPKILVEMTLIARRGAGKKA